MGASPPLLRLCFFVRFMGGAIRRLRPLISRLVVVSSLASVSDSDMSDSDRDQRL